VENEMDYDLIQSKMTNLRKLGVPYTDDQIKNAVISMQEEAALIEHNLRQDPEFIKNYDNKLVHNKEIVALIAYLQRLGTDIKQ
ncbi:MAG: cbb3-type cytochrome c oxidase subunit II, partial [Flavobacteriaceae bacterium]|nr:cbb3-type cytochrome c oxidase subunit II [Flavobacteriaceae bacterium]